MTTLDHEVADYLALRRALGYKLEMHGRLLPGSRIPIFPVEALFADPPDDVIVLPWPNAAEIALKLAPLRQLGTHLWTPLPRIARV